MTRSYIQAAVLVGAAATMCSCQSPRVYQVRRLQGEMPIDADWDKPQWQNTTPLDVDLAIGPITTFRPRTQAKVLYDDQNIYVIFRVEDQCILAMTTERQDEVCRDSCVECFFTPGTDITEGYFNLETNCIGTITLHHQTAARGKRPPPARRRPGPHYHRRPRWAPN